MTNSEVGLGETAAAATNELTYDELVAQNPELTHYHDRFVEDLNFRQMIEVAAERSRYFILQFKILGELGESAPSEDVIAVNDAFGEFLQWLMVQIIEEPDLAGVVTAYGRVPGLTSKMIHGKQMGV